MLFEVREMLYVIIDHVYKNDPIIAYYKKFYLTFVEKKLKSKGGDYNLVKKEIRIMGVGEKSAKDLCLVVLHELAHHIDNVQRGITDHGTEFYGVYKNLVYGALDTGFVTVSDVKWVIENGNYNDAKKVAQFLQDYSGYSGDIKSAVKGNLKICVYNSYDIRFQLKDRGYKYNAVDHSWSIIVDERKLLREKAFLLERVEEKDIDIVDANKIHIRNKTYLEIRGNTFSCREVIKEYGFCPIKEGKKWIWRKEVPDGDAESSLADMRNVLCDYPYIQIIIN